jgi:hypothetical protein
MTEDYSGTMEDGNTFSAAKPFVLLGWPAAGDANTFNTEEEARGFITKVKSRDPYVICGCLYGFSDGKWNRLSI